MIKNSMLKSIALAGLLSLGATAASFAASATSTSNVNIRSGPGTGYGVVDILRRGELVDVNGCQGSWCYVVKPGPDGWVASSYLSSGSGYVQPIPVPVQPSITFSFGNDRNYQPRPRRGDWYGDRDRRDWDRPSRRDGGWYDNRSRWDRY